jgi:hypothetical protein
LSQRFDFSGGQIENIARKHTVESILSGAEPSLETILSFCKEESLEHKSHPIGFCAG